MEATPPMLQLGGMPAPVVGAQWLRRHSAVALGFADRFIERHPLLLMGAILLVYLGKALFLSHTTELQIDELLTYAMVRLPSLSSLWWTLKHYPPALDPPLFPTLAYLSFRLPINFPLSYRLPSIVGYGALMVSIFVFSRRRFPASVALTASVIPMVVPVMQYAVEARPYALALGFSGWALVFWQRATEYSGKRIGALVGLYICLAGLLLSHFLGGLFYLPLIAGELWRSLRRGIDAAMWVVFALAACSIVSYIPLLPAAAPYRINPWHGVVPDDLWQTYLLGIDPILIIFVSLSALWWVGTRKSACAAMTGVTMEQHECIALCGLYLIPMISYLAALAATHSYVARYALAFSIAEAIALAVIFYRITNRETTALVLVILLVCAGQPGIQQMVERPGQNTGGIFDIDVPVLGRFPSLPIFEPSWHDYIRLSLFGPENLRTRMVLVLDPEDIKEKTNFALSTEAVHLALKISEASYSQMITSHPQFLLLEGSRLREELLQEGREVKLVGRLFQRDVYLIQSAAR